VMIGTDYTGNCKSNYHAITVMTAPSGNRIWTFMWLESKTYLTYPHLSLSLNRNHAITKPKSCYHKNEIMLSQNRNHAITKPKSCYHKT
jgi:hypothetical protein